MAPAPVLDLTTLFEVIGPHHLRGGGGLDWIGLVLRSFREGHPGVTGHAAHWARNSDMRTAP